MVSMSDPMFSQPPRPEQDDKSYDNIAGKAFFHGTSKRNARRILKGGFCDWPWTAETPLKKHKAAPVNTRRRDAPSGNLFQYPERRSAPSHRPPVL